MEGLSNTDELSRQEITVELKEIIKSLPNAHIQPELANYEKYTINQQGEMHGKYVRYDADILTKEYFMVNSIRHGFYICYDYDKNHYEISEFQNGKKIRCRIDIVIPQDTKSFFNS